jgi:hypothetical protein
LYFLPASFKAGGAVWHAAQAFFSFAAIAGVAIDCPAVITITAPASSNADVVATARLRTLVCAFRIIALLNIPSIHPAFPNEIWNARTIADGAVIEKA